MSVVFVYGGICKKSKPIEEQKKLENICYNLTINEKMNRSSVEQQKHIDSLCILIYWVFVCVNWPKIVNT